MGEVIKKGSPFLTSLHGKPMLENQSRFEQMLDKVRKKNFRITPQRIALLRILASSEEHPSVERIFEIVKRDFPTTSVATVYKTLFLLKELQEVQELGFPHAGNRYDGVRPYPHPHLICTECKRILDPQLDSLEGMTRELAEETDFTITSHRLDFFGVCPECRRKARTVC